MWTKLVRQDLSRQPLRHVDHAESVGLTSELVLLDIEDFGGFCHRILAYAHYTGLLNCRMAYTINAFYGPGDYSLRRMLVLLDMTLKTFGSSICHYKNEYLKFTILINGLQRKNFYHVQIFCF